MTPLDTAHTTMETTGTDADRLRFFERLADAELFVLLDGEPQGDQITPRLFPLEDASYVLAFDRAERLTQFTGAPAPYAAMSGRLLAQMLAENTLGLGLNLDVAPSSQLLPPSAIAWLVETLGHTPAETEAIPDEIAPPKGLPESLITALDTKLAMAQGLAKHAYLTAVRYSDGRRTHLLGVVEALPEAQPSLARAVAEALTFSGVEAGELDVAFFRASDPICANLAKHGLRFDLPELPPQTAQPPGANPGMDPNTPPRLR